MRGLLAILGALLVASAGFAGCGGKSCTNGVLQCPCGDGTCQTGACSDNCGNLCAAHAGQQSVTDAGTDYCAWRDGG